jgi:hypothetical protein
MWHAGGTTDSQLRPNRQHIELRHAVPVAAFAMKSGEAVLITATRRLIRPEKKEQLRVARRRLALARPEIMANMPDSAEPRVLMHGQNDSGGRYAFRPRPLIVRSTASLESTNDGPYR